MDAGCVFRCDPEAIQKPEKMSRAADSYLRKASASIFSFRSGAETGLRVDRHPWLAANHP